MVTFVAMTKVTRALALPYVLAFGYSKDSFSASPSHNLPSPHKQESPHLWRIHLSIKRICKPTYFFESHWLISQSFQLLKHTSICMKLKSRNQTRFVELCKHEKNTCEKLQGHNEWLRTFCQQGSSVEETWILPARPPDGMWLTSHHAGGNTSTKKL